MENTNQYSTTDLSLAAALSLLHTLSEVTHVDARRVAFIFENSDQLQTDIGRYWNHELLVEPQAFFYQLKQLKNRIYSQ